MYKRGLTLVSKRTGEKYHFESILHATMFLNRGNCYINTIEKAGGAVKHADTGEEFVVIRDVLPQIGKTKVLSMSHGQMLDKSICNGCARAVCFCSWFANHTPVEGWVAERSYYEGEPYSFRVIECPLFEEDAPTVEGRRIQRKRLLKEAEDG